MNRENLGSLCNCRCDLSKCRNSEYSSKKRLEHVKELWVFRKEELLQVWFEQSQGVGSFMEGWVMAEVIWVSEEVVSIPKGRVIAGMFWTRLSYDSTNKSLRKHMSCENLGTWSYYRGDLNKLRSSEYSVWVCHDISGLSILKSCDYSGRWSFVLTNELRVSRMVEFLQTWFEQA